MADMTSAGLCAKCCKHTTQFLGKLEVGNSVVCPIAGDITNVTKEDWQSALR